MDDELPIRLTDKIVCRTDYMGDAAEGKEEGLGNDLDKVNIADPQFQV